MMGDSCVLSSSNDKGEIVKRLSWVLVLGTFFVINFGVTISRAADTTSALLLGWSTAPGTAYKQVCPDTRKFPVRGGSGCGAVTGAWSGGVFDTKRDRLVFLGGGFTDYYGNELYAYNVGSQTIERLTDPGLPLASCSDAIANGTQPGSRQTGNGIAYIESKDQLFMFGGRIACRTSIQSKNTWVFDFSSNTWQLKKPTGTLPSSAGHIMTSYDATSDKVYLHDGTYLYAYDPAADFYQRFDNSKKALTARRSAAIDPKRQKFVMIGGGKVQTIRIGTGSTYALEEMATTGSTAIVATQWPGVAYDPITDKMIAWNGGNNIYSLDLDTGVWTSTPHAGAPMANKNGTFGRFRYSPQSNVFVSVNGYTSDVAVLKLTEKPAVKDDIADLCRLPGVFMCDDFEDPAKVQGTIQAGGNSVKPEVSFDQAFSGKGSLRFRIPSNSGADSSGSYYKSISSAIGHKIRPGQSLYIRFRQKMDTNAVNLKRAFGGTGFKHFIVWDGSSSCTTLQYVLASLYYKFPIVYTSCGSGKHGFHPTLSNGDILLQSGPNALSLGEAYQNYLLPLATEYRCSYREDKAKPGAAKCSYYKEEQWMTYYVEMKLGDFGKPNSTMKVLVGYEGEPMKYTIHSTTGTFNHNGKPETDGFSHFLLTPYQTGKDKTVVHPDAYMWVDDLVLSTEPLPIPTP